MALRGVCLYRTTILLLKLLVTYVDAQFINNANNITECSGGTASFSWTYATSTPVLFVEWKKDESSIALETGGTFAPEAPYVGRLTKISNAHVSLGSLSVADSGIYKSEVTYTDGNAYASNSVSLVVYDELNSETRIKKTSGTRMVTLSPVFLDLSITYTWKSQDNVTHMTGFSLDVTKIGNYTMCISGGRADCLNPALSPCASIDVTGFDGCKYSDAELFLGGFSCFLIVFGITSIIMLIFLLCQMLPKIFDDKKTNKIIIIVVFNSLALIFGFALGFGLKECEKKRSWSWTRPRIWIHLGNSPCFDTLHLP